MASDDKEIESIRTVIPASTVSLLFLPRALMVRELDKTAQPVGIETTDVIDDFQTHRETQHTHSGHSTCGSAFALHTSRHPIPGLRTKGTDSQCLP